MVALRNTYLTYVSSHPTLATYELLVVMDLDLQSFLYVDGLLSTAHHLHNEPTTAAVAANGLQLTAVPLTFSLVHGFEYQDPYAHEDATNAGKSLPQQLDNVRSKWGNRFHYGAPLRPVVSAFGGFTVYRMAAVAGRWYSVTYAEVGGYVLCEHVSLNRQLAAGGSGVGGSGGVYLNPSMMHVILDNTDGYVDRHYTPMAVNVSTMVTAEWVDPLLATS